jgi:trimethylamine--corrinoid protein Co-methyltransferase
MPLTLTPLLGRAELERIHARSLDLLERVGVEYRTPRALEVLEQRGCRVDYPRRRACLPPGFVEEMIRAAPRVVRLPARDPARDVLLDGSRPHHVTDSQGCKAVDLDTGEVRPSRAEDLRHSFRLADALERIDIVHPMVAANDVPAHVRTLRHFALAFTHTSKHVRSGVLHAGQVPFLVEMARAAAGGGEFRPIFSAVDCTISPLLHDGAMTEACIELVKLGVPILLHPMPLAGGTSPAAPAGTILLHNVEFLSGLALFQAVRPGAAVIYGAGAAQLDLISGRYLDSASANAMRLALVEMARFYNLPVNAMGLSTSSEALDVHYGHEATASCLLALLARVDEVYSMGLLGSSQFLSLDKMVLDHRLTLQLEAMLESIAVDEIDSMASLIERVGIGRHFLKEKETLAWARSRYRPVWPPAGKQMRELARREVADILREHAPEPLPAGAADKIEEIVTEAESALAPSAEEAG